MAEFCLNCWNKMNHTRLKEEDVILSSELDICEGCAKVKPTVVRYSSWFESIKIRRKIKQRKKNGQ